MKNIKFNQQFEIEVKRFYIPLETKVNCPHCNAENEVDLNGMDYLSYPTLNKAEVIYRCCDKCDKEFEFDLTLRMSVDMDTKMRKL